MMYSTSYNTYGFAAIVHGDVHGGGEYRAYESIKQYVRSGLTAQLILLMRSLNTDLRALKRFIGVIMSNKQTKIIGIATNVLTFLLKRNTQTMFANTFLSFAPFLLKLNLKSNFNDNLCFTVSMHEHYDTLLVATKIADMYDTKLAAIMQLPPYITNRRRQKNIQEALRLWYELVDTKRKPIYDIYSKLFYNKILEINKTNYKKLLKKFNIIIAVSKSIPYEMGDCNCKMFVLNPGVGLSKHDLDFIEKVKLKYKDYKVHSNIVVFGGRPNAVKGVHEALLAWRYIVRHNPNLKLYITGNIDYRTKVVLERFINRLGIRENVVITGFIPRSDRLKLIAKAKAVIYPSHMDAYPFSVYEALCLATPVISYDIPAINLNFNKLEGIITVKELGIKELYEVLLNIISSTNIKIYDIIECPHKVLLDNILYLESQIIINSLCS